MVFDVRGWYVAAVWFVGLVYCEFGWFWGWFGCSWCGVSFGLAGFRIFWLGSWIGELCLVGIAWVSGFGCVMTCRCLFDLWLGVLVDTVLEFRFVVGGLLLGL